jgi:hypothetical protein
MVGELLRLGLACEAAVVPPGHCIDDLKMPQLGEEHFVQHESTHGHDGPDDAALRAEDTR